jgi:hypothetical protein
LSIFDRSPELSVIVCSGVSGISAKGLEESETTASLLGDLTLAHEIVNNPNINGVVNLLNLENKQLIFMPNLHTDC